MSYRYKFKEGTKLYPMYKDLEFTIIGEPILGYASVLCLTDASVKITRYVNTYDMEIVSGYKL